MRHTLIIIGAVIAIAVGVFVIVLGVRQHQNRVAQCQARGGSVQTEPERKFNKRTQKWTTETEHECLVGGREVDEW